MAKSNELDIRRDDDMLPDFERMAERFFGDRFGSLMGDLPMSGSRKAVTDIRETDQGYVLSADLPGIPKEEIEVNVSGNLLTVRAEHKEESGEEGREGGYRRQYRSFNQSFSLPSNVDPAKVEAHCENGLLEVWIPKTEQSQPRKIDLQSGKGGFWNRLRGKSGSEEKKH
jgi:HSP20 family protein